MRKKTKIKNLALECVLLAMEAVKNNIELATRDEQINANTEAMERLAKAYALIDGTYND